MIPSFLLLQEIAKHIDVVLLAIALVCILFFFFFSKSKVGRQASLRSYAMLFYAFIFFLIASLSYVALKATYDFMAMHMLGYDSYLWYFPFTLLSALFGMAIGWLIWFSASKVAKGYELKLLNYSLVIIAPAVVYVMLIQPFHEALLIMGSAYLPVSIEEKNPNLKSFFEVKEKVKQPFVDAMPAELFDSLQVMVSGPHQLTITHPATGYTFSATLQKDELNNVYVCKAFGSNYLAVLALCRPISMYAYLLVFDKMGNEVYRKLYTNYPNRLSVSADTRFLCLERELADSTREMVNCLELK